MCKNCLHLFFFHCQYLAIVCVRFFFKLNHPKKKRCKPTVNWVINIIVCLFVDDVKLIICLITNTHTTLCRLRCTHTHTHTRNSNIINQMIVWLKENFFHFFCASHIFIFSIKKVNYLSSECVWVHQLMMMMKNWGFSSIFWMMKLFLCAKNIFSLLDWIELDFLLKKIFFIHSFIIICVQYIMGNPFVSIDW